MLTQSDSHKECDFYISVISLDLNYKMMFSFAERSASDRWCSDLLWAVQRQQLRRQNRRLCVRQDGYRRKSHLPDWFYLDQCWVCIAFAMTKVDFNCKIWNRFIFCKMLPIAQLVCKHNEACITRIYWIY